MPASIPPELQRILGGRHATVPESQPFIGRTWQCLTLVDEQTTDFETTAVLAYIRQEANRRQTGRFPGPWHLEICPTSLCPIHCKFCSYSERNKVCRTLSDEVINQVISDAHSLGVVGIYFSGGGDPLAKRNLAEHVEHAAVRCGVAIQTNAIGLHQLLARGWDWFNRHVDLITWSIYAHEPELFSTTCRGSEEQFKHIVGNVRQAIAFRDRWDQEARMGLRSLPPTHISGKIVIGRENFRAIENLVAFATSFRLDTVHIRLVDNYEAGQDVALGLVDLQALRHIASTSSDELVKSLSEMLRHSKIEPTVCPGYSIEYGINAIVETSGDVYLSIPSDGLQGASIGNVHARRLLELWGGERHMQVIEMLNKLPKPPISKNRHHKVDLAIHEYLHGKRTLETKCDMLSDWCFRKYQRAQI